MIDGTNQGLLARYLYRLMERSKIVRILIPVLLQKNTDQNDPSDLLQQWKNGTDYICLESKEDIDELGSFLKTNDAEGVKAVHIFFPHDLDATPQVSTHIALSLSGFSDGFGAFQTACVPSK